MCIEEIKGKPNFKKVIEKRNYKNKSNTRCTACKLIIFPKYTFTYKLPLNITFCQKVVKKIMLTFDSFYKIMTFYVSCVII